MRCRRLRPLLPAAVDDRLDQRARRDVDAHVAVCGTCDSQLRAMRDVQRALRACGPAEPPRDLATRIARSVRLAAAAQREARSLRDRFIVVAWRTALGASLAAAILLVLALRQPDARAPGFDPAGADPIAEITAPRQTADQLGTAFLAVEID